MLDIEYDREAVRDRLLELTNRDMDVAGDEEPEYADRNWIHLTARWSASGADEIDDVLRGLQAVSAFGEAVEFTFIYGSPVYEQLRPEILAVFLTPRDGSAGLGALIDLTEVEFDPDAQGVDFAVAVYELLAEQFEAAQNNVT